MTTKASSLDELIRSDFGDALVVISGQPTFYPTASRPGKRSFVELVEHSPEELIAWLTAKDVPQLINGHYWREFSDFAVHGVMEFDARTFAGEPADPYFKLTVSRQAPKPLFG